MKKKRTKTYNPICPNRIGTAAQAEINRPLTNAVIALRLGYAEESHYHDLAAAMMIGFKVTELVDRHRGLQPDMQLALNALNAIWDRQAQRTVKDSFYSGTTDEVNALDDAVRIYAALIKTSSGKAMRSAISRVRMTTERGFA